MNKYNNKENNINIDELDVVILKIDFPECNLSKGKEGTVVYKYNDSTFEVEFLDELGHTLHLGTFSSNDIEPKYKKGI